MCVWTWWNERGKARLASTKVNNAFFCNFNMRSDYGTQTQAKLIVFFFSLLSASLLGINFPKSAIHFFRCWVFFLAIYQIIVTEFSINGVVILPKGKQVFSLRHAISLHSKTVDVKIFMRYCVPDRMILMYFSDNLKIKFYWKLIPTHATVLYGIFHIPSMKQHPRIALG